MANAATATYAGRTILWQRVIGFGSEPKNIKWGTVPTVTSLITASANGNVALFCQANESGVAGTSNILQSANGYLGDTYYVSGTITCLTGAKTITEAALSDSVTLSPAGSLATSQTAALTTLSLGAAGSFPSTGNFYVQVENETELVTAGQGTAALTVTRAQLGTTSAIHGAGAPVLMGGDGGASGVALGGQTSTPAQVFCGNIFAHADFSGIALNVADSILFSWFDTLT